jgi:hypothetical protein
MDSPDPRGKIAKFFWPANFVTKSTLQRNKRQREKQPMTSDQPIAENAHFSIRSAARFWEPRRLLYNLALTATALFWLFKDWTLFLPAMKWSTLRAVSVLALLANLCYCAAYLADLAIQQLPSSAWTRSRWAVFSLGTLFAMLFASYWINDEIYPYVNQAATLLWR